MITTTHSHKHWTDEGGHVTLKEGNVAQQIDRCLNWVKAEASEAASLVDSCVPHGKPMLAQAQKRLEVLESLKLLQRLAESHFAES